MNCPRLESVLADYMDEVLSAPVRGAVDEHLQGCERCRLVVEDVRLATRDIAAFPQVMPSEGSKRRIMLATSGLPRQRSLWRDLLLPTLQPFLTQRFAFATGIMFVFLSLMVNLMGPGFSTLSYSDLSPAKVMSQVSKKWNQFREARARFFEELSLMAEDLSGRIDYHVISNIFESYQESVREGEGTPAEGAETEGAPPAGGESGEEGPPRQ